MLTSWTILGSAAAHEGVRQVIVSLHLPKTGGRSFGRALKKHFGARLMEDYGDRAMTRSESERWAQARSAAERVRRRDWSGVDCVHGHFMPAKYAALADRKEVTFVTWMRDPVDRIVSHYDYWTRNFDPRTAPAHHRRVVEEGWSLERFCLSSEYRNLYCQYLRGFPFERFDFIGITELYGADLRAFSSRFLRRPLKRYRVNVTRRWRRRPPIDDGLRGRIASHHRDDLELYRRALELRERRCSPARDEPG